MKTFLKWAAIAVAAVVILLVCAVLVLSQMGASKVDQTYTVQTVANLSFVADSAALARGEHIGKVAGCNHCHGTNYEGQVFLDVPPFRVVAANLTSGQGGVGEAYTPADWERAVRQGIDPDGHGLMAMMPSRAYYHFSDADVEALAVFLDQLPPIDNELPATELHLIGKVIAATNPMFVPELIDASVTPPATTPTDPMELGRYWSQATCQECHGADLRGAPHPGGPDYPYATDLAVVNTYSYEAFTAAMREGIKLGGTQMDGEIMPWVSFQHFTEEELSAIYMYLQTVGADDTIASVSP